MAAEALKITARDLSQLGIIDELFLNRKEERTWTTRVPLRFWIRYSIARFGICSRSLPARCSNNGTKKFRRMGQFFESVRS